MRQLQIALMVFLILVVGTPLRYTASDIVTSTTYVTTYTYTTSVSYTTTTTTYTLSSATVETTSTTTSVTATRVSTSLESITLLTTATVQLTLWFTETRPTTVTLTETSTIFSPTVTVPTTRVTTASTTIYSPTVTVTSTVSTRTTTTTTSTFMTTITTYSPTVTLTSKTRIVTTIIPLRMLYPFMTSSATDGSGSGDRLVRPAFAGVEFMKTFDTFYSTFSLTAVSVVVSSQAIAAAVRLFLYPLQGIFWTMLAIFHAFGLAVEAGMIVAELVSSALFGIIYVTPVALGIQYLFRKKGNLKRPIKVSSTGPNKDKRNRQPAGMSQ